MNIKEISLGRTLNVGNFESVRFEITVSLEKTETFEKVYKQLQKKVDAQETKLRREYKAK